MKNWEAFEAEIKKIGEVDFAYLDGTVLPCEDVPSCNGCSFEPPYDYSCAYIRMLWLYDEAEPMLTPEEKAFVDMLENGYVARDKNGSLLLFDSEPHRLNIYWTNAKIDSEGHHMYGRRCTEMNKDKFKFIQWENEPYKIEDLKRLKVQK